ncbi:hypothetical protein [Cutibacterium sp.]|uniref:hypothetical protein n=1 Tax=Cutibacterium sp. TaxID=1912221 RepID=UPI0026DCF64E|nr:hypothetical protein [Cutibacterium sp.]MDO4411574.1 hypothetical protein [Cutibacterium sp.]
MTTRPPGHIGPSSLARTANSDGHPHLDFYAYDENVNPGSYVSGCTWNEYTWIEHNRRSWPSGVSGS